MPDNNKAAATTVVFWFLRAKGQQTLRSGSFIERVVIMSYINKFRLVSLLEGVSFLLLLFVAMPLKYQMGVPQAVTVMGWAHGLLFIAYVSMAMNLSNRQGWSGMFSTMVVLAGMVPFACFFLEKRLKKEVPQEALQNS